MSAGAKERALKRIPNPMDWRPLDRALLMIAGSGLYVIGAAVIYAALPHTTLDEYLNRDVLALAVRINYGVGALWSLLFVLALRERRAGRSGAAFVEVYIHSWVVNAAWAVHLPGTFHTPLWLMVAAGLFLAMLLLDEGIVARAMVFGFVLNSAMVLSEFFGAIRYAPLFLAAPFASAQGPIDAWGVVMSFVVVVFMIGFWAVGRILIRRWQEREDELRALSTTDALTQLPNRRHFMHTLEREVRRSTRQGTDLSVLLCDADHFKRVNDEHGHATGDVVLVGLADAIRGAIREDMDLAGRLGGEEFAVVLPGTSRKAAAEVAERIREAVRSTTHDGEAGPVNVTVSIGVGSRDGVESDAQSLLREADGLLYLSKEGGRDRVSVGPLSFETD